MEHCGCRVHLSTASDRGRPTAVLWMLPGDSGCFNRFFRLTQSVDCPGVSAHNGSQRGSQRWLNGSQRELIDGGRQQTIGRQRMSNGSRPQTIDVRRQIRQERTNSTGEDKFDRRGRITEKQDYRDEKYRDEKTGLSDRLSVIFTKLSVVKCDSPSILGSNTFASWKHCLLNSQLEWLFPEEPPTPSFQVEHETGVSESVEFRSTRVD